VRPLRWIAILCLAGLAAACSLDYQATELEAGDTSSIPDTIATNLTYRVVKNSRLSLQLTADESRSYTSKKETLLDGAHFVEYDQKGEAVTDGKANSIVFHSESRDAEISGQVSVYSAVQKGSISTEYLAWEDAGKILTADPTERVVVKKDDGSYITGRGFVGNFRIRGVTFSGPVEGTYVYEEK
jgi:LPS export ABC transporter protein LptC